MKRVARRPCHRPWRKRQWLSQAALIAAMVLCMGGAHCRCSAFFWGAGHTETLSSEPLVEEEALAEQAEMDNQIAGEDSGNLPTKLISVAELRRQLPIPRQLKAFINSSRHALQAVLDGQDDRLIAVTGPCSIHDRRAARDYAQRLRRLAQTFDSELLVVMRTYLEKPRTAVGWKGFITDPDMTGVEDMQSGVKQGRKVLLEMNAAGLPTAVEFLDPLVAPYLADLVAYGSIGARTVESPTHRALAASLDMPIGFKNTRSGDVHSAVNAVIAAAAAQRFLTPDYAGHDIQIKHASGNAYGHVILRGGENGPNFHPESVNATAELLLDAGLEGRRVVIDCSHGNSGKVHEGQVTACKSVARQIAAGADVIGGVMIESFILAGSQKLVPGETPLSSLRYGRSVTDACVDIGTTKDVFKALASAVRARRERKSET